MTGPRNMALGGVPEPGLCRCAEMIRSRFVYMIPGTVIRERPFYHRSIECERRHPMSGIMISLLLALAVYGYSVFKAEKSSGI